MTDEFNDVTESSSELTPPERRTDARYPFTATVEVVEPKSKTRIQGRTSDLSRGGCYVDTISSFPTGTIVEMSLKKENRSFEVQAKVAYSLDGMGMGVKFIPAAPEQMHILEKWIGQLSGELPFEPEVNEPAEQPSIQRPTNNEPYYVLNELIIELMRQGILTDTKCKTLLQQLHCGGQADSKTSNTETRQ